MNNKKQIILSLFAGMGLSILIIFILVIFTPAVKKDMYYAVNQTYRVIENNYMGEIDNDKMIEGIKSGMMNSLGDPHSVYFNTENAKLFNSSLEDTLYGIGVTITSLNDEITITSVIENSPAEKSGLNVGDIIYSVDSVKLNGMSASEATEYIKGPEGTTVTLEIGSIYNSEIREVEITRGEINIPNIKSELLIYENQKYGYIKINSFSSNVGIQFEEILNDFENQNIDGLIIDVRNNGGGYLNEVEYILNLLVSSDLPIYQTKDQYGNIVEVYSTLEEPKKYDIVLIQNFNSASASEILSVGLKEAGNYEIVGTTSYGKGSVQQTIPDLKDNGLYKITISEWLSPKGNQINGVGIEPTVDLTEDMTLAKLSVVVPKGEYYEYDDVNISIKIAQSKLKAMGYNIDRTDGYYSQDTENAVKDFQSDNNLEVTGHIDSITASTINFVYNDLGAIVDPFVISAINTLE